MTSFTVMWKWKQNQGENMGTYLLKGAFVGPNTFDQRDSERVQLVRLVSLVDDGQRDAEAQAFEIANLLVQGDDFRQEVHSQPESVATAGSGTSGFDQEDTPGNSGVAFLYLAGPLLKHFRRGQLGTETVSVGFQLLSIDVRFPAFAEYVFDTLQIHGQLIVDLASPDDRTRNRWKIAYNRQPAAFTLRILNLQEIISNFENLWNKFYS